jgi:hypothetical protein
VLKCNVVPYYLYFCEGKGKVHPVTCYEGKRGSRDIALLLKPRF